MPAYGGGVSRPPSSSSSGPSVRQQAAARAVPSYTPSERSTASAESRQGTWRPGRVSPPGPYRSGYRTEPEQRQRQAHRFGPGPGRGGGLVQGRSPLGRESVPKPPHREVRESLTVPQQENMDRMFNEGRRLAKEGKTPEVKIT